MNRIVLIVAVAMATLGSLPLQGQTKKETRRYNKALELNTEDGYNDFLKKFPNSVYVPKVEHLVDSIHFQQVDTNDIASCASFLKQYPESGYLELVDGRMKELALADRYVQDGSLSFCRVVKDFENHEFSGKGYYFYIYENLASEVEGELAPGMRCEYVVNLLDKESGMVHSSMFSGKVIAAESEKGYMIEGDYMDEGSAGNYLLPEALYLLGVLKESDLLLPISDADVMTDQAIEWWLKSNPSKAKRLKFGLLPQESSIVENFKGVKEYESKGNYKVAMFDIRGYTVIAAHQKSSNEYMLVWAEPVCKDKKSDPLLNTIYFENATSLVLYYYQGRTTYKVRVNMANKTIAR